MNGSYKNDVSRRDFLSSTAMGLLGYSLMVSVDAEASPLAGKSAAAANCAAKKSNSKNSLSFSQSTMQNVELDCDVFVAGGGLSGICAALAAARSGAKVVMVQNRSRLGGNGSSEVRMHALGINSEKVGFRECGILEELKLKNIVENPEFSWVVWDVMLYDKIRCEKNITLLLDTTVYGADVVGGVIEKAYARCDMSMTNYVIKAKQYIDCTGDARLAEEAGAQLMSGREGSEKYGESLAGVFTKGDHLCCSMMFTSRDVGHEVKFTAPSWAHKITAENLKFREPADFLYGYWFISFGGKLDIIHDTEVIRRELLSILLGVWDYFKNSGKYPQTKNLDLDFVAMFPARRDTNRIVGYDIFTQHDIEGKWRQRPDQIITVGWPMEDQPSDGFYFKGKPAIYGGSVPFYNLPLSVMYSSDVKNLFMAGRNMNTSHIAFTSTRIMNTGALAGEVVGNAAAMCAREGVMPREFATNADALTKLRRKLMKDGNIIVGFKNDDPDDLARSASVSATVSARGTSAANILNGISFDTKGSDANKWLAPIAEKPVVELSWKSPVKISEVRLNLDAGCRMITQTSQVSFVKKMIHAPQPETLRDFDIVAVLPDGAEKTLVQVRGNYQKLVVAKFDCVEVKALKVKCLASNGSEYASIFELRAYKA